RGGFGMAPAARRMRERADGRGDLLAREAVDAVARHPAEAALRRFAVEPLWKEGTDHVVAHGELRDAFADREHLAGAVGHGNALFARPRDALHHHVVMEVQGTGAHAHGDLARSRLHRLRAADRDVLETAAGGDVDGLDAHGETPYGPRPRIAARRW